MQDHLELVSNLERRQPILGKLFLLFLLSEGGNPSQFEVVSEGIRLVVKGTRLFGSGIESRRAGFARRGNEKALAGELLREVVAPEVAVEEVVFPNFVEVGLTFLQITRLVHLLFSNLISCK